MPPGFTHSCELASERGQILDAIDGAEIRHHQIEGLGDGTDATAR